MKKIATFVLAGMFISACAQNKQNNDTAEVASAEVETVTDAKVADTPPTIVGVAAGNDAFSTLVAAVKAAGLVETLSGEGPFTVFAPTNDAFGKLPAGTVEGLLKPEAKGTLTAVLTYHVVAGKFEAAAVVDAIKKNNGKFEVKTVQGGTITLSLEGGNVVLTDATGAKSTVIIPDVAASNGVIHAIDSVVMPQ
ncbi:fasciclin domain-containing protein [Gilvibacter sp. SZ-19]|uniref:fasciclin domain-containing protein n=1 Tax=Gilvibacter sp. SZ-19 TaxID=754429 RepID=UPI000B3CC97A|nr:fasciclin domain-containing protein [Gilvibacter sp. SZ-19]